MRSQQGHEKVKEEIERKQGHCVKSYHIKDIIGTLLYNSFIELLRSKLQHLGKSKDSYNSPGHAKQGRIENATKRVASKELKKFMEKSKENNVSG